jgi:hypothetical protein
MLTTTTTAFDACKKIACELTANKFCKTNYKPLVSPDLPRLPQFMAVAVARIEQDRPVRTRVAVAAIGILRDVDARARGRMSISLTTPLTVR